MEKPNAIDGIQCPSCPGDASYQENPLRPYCCSVCSILGRYELGWRAHPYRIVVNTRPDLIVQAGPSFDLRDSALKGARERALASERKRRQRRRFSAAEMSRQPSLMEQSKASVGVPLSVSGVENSSTEGNLDPLPAKS